MAELTLGTDERRADSQRAATPRPSRRRPGPTALAIYKKPRLGPRVWGLSGSWLAVCLWNGDTAWIQLPFLYFGIGTKNVELLLGRGWFAASFEIRWRWS